MEIYILGSLIAMTLLVVAGIIETVRGTAEKLDFSDVLIFLGLAICSWGSVILIVVAGVNFYIFNKGK